MSGRTCFLALLSLVSFQAVASSPLVDVGTIVTSLGEFQHQTCADAVTIRIAKGADRNLGYKLQYEGTYEVVPGLFTRDRKTYMRSWNGTALYLEYLEYTSNGSMLPGAWVLGSRIPGKPPSVGLTFAEWRDPEDRRSCPYHLGPGDSNDSWRCLQDSSVSLIVEPCADISCTTTSPSTSAQGAAVASSSSSSSRASQANTTLNSWTTFSSDVGVSTTSNGHSQVLGNVSENTTHTLSRTTTSLSSSLSSGIPMDTQAFKSTTAIGRDNNSSISTTITTITTTTSSLTTTTTTIASNAAAGTTTSKEVVRNFTTAAPESTSSVGSVHSVTATSNSTGVTAPTPGPTTAASSVSTRSSSGIDQTTTSAQPTSNNHSTTFVHDTANTTSPSSTSVALSLSSTTSILTDKSSSPGSNTTLPHATTAAADNITKTTSSPMTTTTVASTSTTRSTTTSSRLRGTTSTSTSSTTSTSTSTSTSTDTTTSSRVNSTVSGSPHQLETPLVTTSEPVASAASDHVPMTELQVIVNGGIAAMVVLAVLYLCHYFSIPASGYPLAFSSEDEADSPTSRRVSLDESTRTPEYLSLNDGP